jgi:group I intron endonuclease
MAVISKGIYLIYCLANQRVYIGQSKNIMKRLGCHLASLKKGNHENDYLQKAYNKYGDDMFVFRPIESIENSSLEYITAREQHWIDQFDSMNPSRGFNLRKAGNRGAFTKETRAKMSEAAKANAKILSEEEKEKLREIGRKQAALMKGKKLGPMPKEQRENLILAQTGKKASEETKKKMSETRKEMYKISPKKGKPTSEETKEKLRETTRAYWERKRQNLLSKEEVCQ